MLIGLNFIPKQHGRLWNLLNVRENQVFQMKNSLAYEIRVMLAGPHAHQAKGDKRVYVNVFFEIFTTTLKVCITNKPIK